MSERIVLTAADIGRSLTRISHEIIENIRGREKIIVLGIHTRGVSLARRLVDNIEKIEPGIAEFGSLDVTMYRDDLGGNPLRIPGTTEIPSQVEGTVVVLVDDVLYSGRTIRAALDAVNEIGRPKAIKLAVLVDRGHRELPIRADFVGKNIPTAQRERVLVRLVEHDGVDEVGLASA